MQQGFAALSAGMEGKDVAPKPAEAGKPRAQIAGKLLVDFAAQVLGEGGAFARSGNGDLQVAATHDRAEKEIAIGDVVHAVAEDVSLNYPAINSRVYLRRIRGSDNNKVVVKVGDFEASLNPFEFPFGREFANFKASLGSNNAKSQSSSEQAANLVARDVACAYQKAAAAIKFEKDGQ
jgi:hypothetical protein